MAKKRRIRWKNLFTLIIIVALFIYVVFKFIQVSFMTESPTYNLSVGEIHFKDDYKALIIRNELILTSNTTGKITQVSNEGEKVKSNQRLLDITGIEALDDMSDAPEVQMIVPLSMEDIDQSIDQLKKDIASNLRNENFEEVHQLSETLALKIEQRRLISETEDVTSTTINSVGNKDLGVGESQSIYAPQTGLLTYYIDGYEDDFTYDKIFNIPYDQIEQLVIEPFVSAPNTVVEGEILCKIVDDSSYYLILYTEPGAQNKYDIYNDLIITTASKEVTGSIEHIAAAGDKVAIAVKLDEYIDGFYKNRFIDVSVTQETYYGLTIQTSSLVKYEDGFGVLVVDKLDKVIFKPVEIVVHNGDTAIVKENFFYRVIEDKNERVDSVSRYDKVLLDGTAYQPGDTLK